MMKRIRSLMVLIACLIPAVMNAQAFMRYHMKDGSYNGFYTNYIDSIKHVTENGEIVQKVYCGELVKTIPTNDIVDISFESATLNNGNAGEYKIGEFEGNDNFKKAYVDNRASLIASKTGDFFANDTILLASAYNDFKCLLFTDENGRITRYFDGNNYLIFDNEDDFFIVEPSTVSYSNSKNTRAPIKAIWNAIYKVLTNKKVKAGIDAFEMGHSYFAQNMELISNNPEFRTQRLWAASLSMISSLIDPLSYLSSVLVWANDGNETLQFIDDFYGGVGSSYRELLNEMYPNTETMEKYKQFYQDKYGINIFALPATNVQATSAILKGTISSADKLKKGNVYFKIWPMGSEFVKEIQVTPVEIVNNQYEVNAQATQLTPGTWYVYNLVYNCTVDGLHFTYSSEPKDFTTLTPTVITGDAENVTSSSAMVHCEYKDCDEGICAVAYSAELNGGGTEEGMTVAQGDGQQSISLTGLHPNTTYTYQAVVQYGEKSFYGESKTFTTDPISLAGTWTLNIDGNEKARTLTLTEGGSVIETEDVDESFNGGSWVVQGNECTIRKMAVFGNTYVTFVLEGTFEGDNPTTITGSKYNENVNSVTGIPHKTNPIPFIMTK